MTDTQSAARPLCRYFLKGNCARGNSCKFPHARRGAPVRHVSPTVRRASQVRGKAKDFDAAIEAILTAGRSGSPEDVRRANEARVLRARILRDLEDMATTIENSVAGIV